MFTVLCSQRVTEKLLVRYIFTGDFLQHLTVQLGCQHAHAHTHTHTLITSIHLSFHLLCIVALDGLAMCIQQKKFHQNKTQDRHLDGRDSPTKCVPSSSNIVHTSRLSPSSSLPPNFSSVCASCKTCHSGHTQLSRPWYAGLLLHHQQRPPQQPGRRGGR